MKGGRERTNYQHKSKKFQQLILNELSRKLDSDQDFIALQELQINLRREA